MFKTLIFVLIPIVTSYRQLSYIESLQKCSITDSVCLKQLSESIMQDMVERGLPELGIPRLDPLDVKDMSVSITNIMDLALVDGAVEGMKTCKLGSFDVNINEKVTKINTFCDFLTIKGIYNAMSAPVWEKLFGNTVTGKGNGSITMDKLKMHFKIPFDVKKQEDGEIYLVPDFDTAEYSYDTPEKATFSADHVTLGNLEIAPMVNSFLNRNWKYVIYSFGRFISDKAMAMSYSTGKKVFSSIPAKYYISDDLSQYLKLRGYYPLFRKSNY